MIGGTECIYCGGFGFGCLSCALTSFRLKAPDAPDAKPGRARVELDESVGGWVAVLMVDNGEVASSADHTSCAWSKDRAREHLREVVAAKVPGMLSVLDAAPVLTI